MLFAHSKMRFFANWSIRNAIMAIGWSLGTHFGGWIMVFLLACHILPFVIKEWYWSSPYREKWGKLKMSRKETIKPPRLVIQWILSWLVDTYLLCSSGSLFLGIIHLTNCHGVQFSIINKNRADFMREEASCGGKKCMSVLTVLPFCRVCFECFQALHDWTQTLWDLHYLDYSRNLSTSD